MKVLLTHASAELYGSDRMAALACGALSAKGHSVTAVLPVAGPLVDEMRDADTAVVIADVPVLRRADLHPVRILGLIGRLVTGLAKMVRIVRAERPDVVYVNTIVQPWWILVGKAMRRTVVVHVREAEPQSPPRVRKLLYAPLLLADLVLCNSASTRDEITSMVPLPTSRTFVVYNGKDWSKYRVPARTRERTDRVRLTVIGRLSQRKGQDTAIRALVGLLAEGHDATLTLVGSVFEGNEDYAHELVALARVHDVLERVEFIGFLDDIRPILAATDIAIVPSRIEPFGTVAAESMAAGLVTVVAEVQGLTEIVQNERNGLTFPPGDHRALAQRCAWVVDNREAAAELARQGQCDVDERFGLDTYQRQIVEFIESADTKESVK
ncbi:glycosyltransferase family 4 protein [Mycobacterium sp. C31M]